MENRIEFVLKPVTGAASTGGGFRAILNTAKGDALDFDEVITEALDLFRALRRRRKGEERPA